MCQFGLCRVHFSHRFSGAVCWVWAGGSAGRSRVFLLLGRACRVPFVPFSPPHTEQLLAGLNHSSHKSVLLLQVIFLPLKSKSNLHNHFDRPLPLQRGSRGIKKSTLKWMQMSCCALFDLCTLISILTAHEFLAA